MEKICKNCENWAYNGSPPGVGYCIVNQWAYRKPTQHCDKILLMEKPYGITRDEEGKVPLAEYLGLQSRLPIVVVVADGTTEPLTSTEELDAALLRKGDRMVLGFGLLR